MANRSELQRVISKMDTSKAKTIYGLSDGQIYINGDVEQILKIATENNLEIFTFKGKALVVEPKVKTAKKEDKVDSSSSKQEENNAIV